MNARRSSNIPKLKQTDTTGQTSENRVIIEAGKYSLDLAKLIFAGVILNSIMEDKSDDTLLLVVGISAMSLFSFLGFLLLFHSKPMRQ